MKDYESKATESDEYEIDNYIEFITSERWQNELIDTLEEIRPAYFYRVVKELRRLFPKVEEAFANAEENGEKEPYDPRGGSGLPAFILCDSELSDEELRKALESEYGVQGIEDIVTGRLNRIRDQNSRKSRN
jgi:hypothetical protein